VNASDGVEIGVNLLDRRLFCFSLLSLPATMSAASLQSSKVPTSRNAIWDHSREIRFELKDLLEHPFYWWPRTLLSYPIEFQSQVDLNRLVLTRTDTREQVPAQFTDVVRDAAGLRTATLNFFSDLPSGGRREFVLSVSDGPVAIEPQVHEHSEGRTIVLDARTMRVRIPASQEVSGDAPGPILQVSRGGPWVGSSTLKITGDRVTRITTSRIVDGPLMITYRIVYETEAGSRYAAVVQCTAGMEFVRFVEDMEGLKPTAQGVITSDWTGFSVTHRHAPNHPYASSGVIRAYDDYPWERIGEPWPLDPKPLVNGELPFKLGIYQTWTAVHTGTYANFWDQHSSDALGVFIDKAEEWQDHEYTSHVESETLQVRYFYQDGRFTWQWPLARGRRSICIAYYDHARDIEAMHRVEEYAGEVHQDGFTYVAGLIYSSHAHFLQNRYGTLDLNCVKDWVLEYGEGARRPPVIFSRGIIQSADDLERRVMAGAFTSTLPVNGTRVNGGASSVPGRGIVNFSPVPSRSVLGGWIDGFNRLSASMSEKQRRRVTAMYLFMAYVHAGEDFMPLVPMLSGHPNFLADVKGVPPAMSFLFPDHPMAATWADLWRKCVEINTRYNTRPDVKTWDARGGRWTEDLGTYVWAFLRPSVRTDFLLRKFDGNERFVTPQLAAMTDWLVNALSAPFDGETAEAYRALQRTDYGHEWGALAAGHGRQRVHPPQGAHSEERVPPRTLWYVGTCLQRFAPLVAEHAMWAARPTNQDMETALGSSDAWDPMFSVPDNRGTNPHLESRKYTGYGIMLRSAVDTPDEVSIHLQQIDQGPNYRWGVASEGGCGVIYYYAAGKAYSFNGSEDVGDRADQDVDFCTNFGVFKDGEFRSIGQNVLSRPMYDLGCGQFAEIVPRQDPGAYSAPEYVSRSIVLAGHDYFLLYDQVLNEQVDHRFSWFVRRGSELPTIKMVRGMTPVREAQRTEIQTEATTGFWQDGKGDAMAVVSHRKDMEVHATPYGCRVHATDIDDLVFRNPDPVEFADGATVFDGTAGLIRTSKDSAEFALFHGTRIGVAGLVFTTADTELGIAGRVAQGQAASGEYYALKASSVSVALLTPVAENLRFFVDGAEQTATWQQNHLTVELAEGHHHWELTDKLPTPIAPLIARTENHAGGARVIAAAVAAATQYRFESSKDSGATWSTIGMQNSPEIELTGLSDREKVHVRAVALNAEQVSAPGPEYPVYGTKDVPPPPDGLRVELAEGSARICWGELLGVSEYQLYARTESDKQFRLLYRGLERSYQDKRAVIHAALPCPVDAGEKAPPDLVQYCVTAVNGNGESGRTPTADTNPGSWRNWDPKPGETFRRDFADRAASNSLRMATQWPHYYPR
jgi:hypothetical protein